MNEKVTNVVGFINDGQKSIAQANRTNFTPGTTDGKPGDMNWPKDFAVPVAGWPAGTDWQFQRSFKVGQNIISNTVPEKYITKYTGTGVWDGGNGRYNIENTFMDGYFTGCKIETGAVNGVWEDVYTITDSGSTGAQNYVYVDGTIPAPHIYYRISYGKGVNLDTEEQTDRGDFTDPSI